MFMSVTGCRPPSFTAVRLMSARSSTKLYLPCRLAFTSLPSVPVAERVTFSAPSFISVLLLGAYMKAVLVPLASEMLIKNLPSLLSMVRGRFVWNLPSLT